MQATNAVCQSINCPPSAGQPVSLEDLRAKALQLLQDGKQQPEKQTHDSSASVKSDLTTLTAPIPQPKVEIAAPKMSPDEAAEKRRQLRMLLLKVEQLKRLSQDKQMQKDISTDPVSLKATGDIPPVTPTLGMQGGMAQSNSQVPISAERLSAADIPAATSFEDLQRANLKRSTSRRGTGSNVVITDFNASGMPAMQTSLEALFQANHSSTSLQSMGGRTSSPMPPVVGLTMPAAPAIEAREPERQHLAPPTFTTLQNTSTAPSAAFMGGPIGVTSRVAPRPAVRKSATMDALGFANAVTGMGGMGGPGLMRLTSRRGAYPGKSTIILSSSIG